MVANELFSPAFWEDVRLKMTKDGQRYGQAVFNTAEQWYPEEARALSGTMYDPFYRDGYAHDFIGALADRLTH